VTGFIALDIFIGEEEEEEVVSGLPNVVRESLVRKQ